MNSCSECERMHVVLYLFVHFLSSFYVDVNMKGMVLAISSSFCSLLIFSSELGNFDPWVVKNVKVCSSYCHQLINLAILHGIRVSRLVDGQQLHL